MSTSTTGDREPPVRDAQPLADATDPADATGPGSAGAPGLPLVVLGAGDAPACPADGICP